MRLLVGFGLRRVCFENWLLLATLIVLVVVL